MYIYCIDCVCGYFICIGKLLYINGYLIKDCDIEV